MLPIMCGNDEAVFTKQKHVLLCTVCISRSRTRIFLYSSCAYWILYVKAQDDMLINCVNSLLNCTYKALIRKVLKPRRSAAKSEAAIGEESKV